MQLKKYDIILCKDNLSWISRLIHIITKDVYNHSELYLGNNHIVDANFPKGVKIRHVDRSLKYFDAYRYTGTITNLQALKIDEFIQKKLNSEYDIIELIAQAFGINKGYRKKYICISLIMEAFRYAGIQTDSWKQGFKQITDSKYFKKIN